MSDYIQDPNYRIFSILQIAIGDWNMDTTMQRAVTHGIADYTKIRMVYPVIVSDAGAWTPFCRGRDNTDGEMQGFVHAWDADEIFLRRLDGGMFDSVDYDTFPSYNRGYLLVFIDEGLEY